MKIAILLSNTYLLVIFLTFSLFKRYVIIYCKNKKVWNVIVYKKSKLSKIYILWWLKVSSLYSIKEKKSLKTWFTKKSYLIFTIFLPYLLIYAKKEEIKCNNIIEQYKKWLLVMMLQNK